MLEQENPTVGGLIQFNQRFHLKNCKTGCYVSRSGIMQSEPSKDYKFYIPKPHNYPDNSPIPYNYPIIINASDGSTSEASRRPVLVPENKSTEEECMPIVVPTNHVSLMGDEVPLEVPVTISTTSTDTRLELFEAIRVETNSDFLLKLARLAPMCKEVRSFLETWIVRQRNEKEAAWKDNTERLVNFVENFCATMNSISTMIKDSHTPELYEGKQSIVVGMDLHKELIDIAEVIFQQTSDQPEHPTVALFKEATKPAFTTVWEVLILVASENFYSCKLLEMHKERICTMVVREKKLIGQLLTEIYRVVDPDMPNYAEDFAGWCRRLETLSAGNIEEQTVFINLIHCLCEVGENVKIEYQKEIVKLLLEGEHPFPLIKFLVKDEKVFVQFYARGRDTVDDQQKCNPSLIPDPEFLKQGMLCMLLENSPPQDSSPNPADSMLLEAPEQDVYINYICAAMALMNTLCKGSLEDGRERVRQHVQITPELVVNIMKRPNIHLKIRQACLNLADTLIAKMEKPTFKPIKDEDDQCFMRSELENDETAAFQERQLKLRSSAINDCIRQTMKLLSSSKLPGHIDVYPFKVKLDYVNATLALTHSLLQNGHYSIHETRKIANALGYFLAGLTGGDASEYKGKHWAVGLLMDNVDFSALKKSMDLKLQVNELFQVLVMLLYITNSVFAREKVIHLLAYCLNCSDPVPAEIQELLQDTEPDPLVTSSFRYTSIQSIEMQEHLLPKGRTKTQQKKHPSASHYMFKLVLNWSAVHPTLKETIISLLEQLFNEKGYILNILEHADVLFDAELEMKYKHFKEMFEDIDVVAVLQEAKRCLLKNAQEPENQEIGMIYALVTEVTDALNPHQSLAGAACIESMQSIVRSVGIHQTFLSVFHFCTQFPLEFDFVHPQLFRLKIALSSFFFYFVRGNSVNIQVMLNLLQKHHYFVLIPRYCDFLRELNQYDHMTVLEHSRFCYYILNTFIDDSGLEIKLNGLYFLKAMMFSKSNRPILDRQNMIARYLVELKREEHIKRVQNVAITSTVIELLALAAIDNDPITLQCSSLMPLNYLDTLSQTSEPLIHHALLMFIFYVYARTSQVERNTEKQSPLLLAFIERSLNVLEPVFSGKLDIVELGKSGMYEQIFPTDRPSIVDEGTTLNPYNPDAALLRLLSSGNEWEIKGGAIHILPLFFKHLTKSKEMKAIVQRFSSRLEQFKKYLNGLQVEHPELNFSILLGYVDEGLKNLSEQLSIKQGGFGMKSFAAILEKRPMSGRVSEIKPQLVPAETHQPDTAPYQIFLNKLKRFIEVYRKTISVKDSETYLIEMVKIFNSVSFGNDQIGVKVSKEKQEDMTKVLRRMKKLFADTRHRRLYFEFLKEVIPVGDTPEDLLRKYALNNIFMDSEVLLEAVNALLKNETLEEVYAVYDFLNTLLDNQNKQFMDDFRTLIDNSEKSYYLFYLIKTELTFVKQQLTSKSNAPAFSKLFEPSKEAEITLTKRQDALVSALVFLQLCCDNCNLEFQDYISSQKKQEGLADLDLVNEVAQFVIDLREVGEVLLRSETAGELLTKALAALLDFVTGPCPKNQQSLGGNVQLYLAINDLLNLTQNEVQSETANLIHEKIMIFMHTLLEGDPPKFIYDNMVNYLSLNDMREGLEKFYETYVKGKKEKFQLELVDLEDKEERCIKHKLDIFILQAILLIKLKKDHENMRELRLFSFDSTDPDAAYNFYVSYIGYVELEKKGIIQSHYFPIPFKCKFFTPSSRRALIYDIDRSSHQKKIEEFVRLMPSANREMQHQQRLSASKTLKYVSSKWKLYARLSFIVVLLINLLLLFSLEGTRDVSLSQEIALKTLGVVQILLYIACVMFLVIEYFPIYFKTDDSFASLEFEKYYRVPFNESQYSKIVVKNIKHLKVKPSAIQLSLREIGNSLGLYYHYLYFLVSIMAIYDPMMYPILLLDLIKQNEELVNVLKSITLNMRQLVLTMILGLIIIFLFSVYAFVFFQGYYDPEENLFCRDLWNCFTTTLNQGIRNGGGIGDALSKPTEEDSTTRMIFDMLFFLIIIIIFLNIIFGIIIDTFAELRDSRKQVLEDINTICYICGTNRSVIDLHGAGWSYHFMCEHSPLAYLAFLIYVNEKERQDCSGIEKYVKEKLEKNDTSFMPTTFKALQVKQSEGGN